MAGGSLARGLALWLDGERAALARGSRCPPRRAPGAHRRRPGHRQCRRGFRAAVRDRAAPVPRARDARGPIAGAAPSALPCLGFLGPGQERYFYELHRFNSREGERVFGPQKLANGPRVRDTTAALARALRPPRPGRRRRRCWPPSSRARREAGRPGGSAMRLVAAGTKPLSGPMDGGLTRRNTPGRPGPRVTMRGSSP